MTRAIIVLPLLALVGCDPGGQVTVNNASPPEVAAKVEAARLDGDFIRAGQWEVKGRIDDIQVPGMPPEFASRMRSAGAEMDGARTCISDADAKKPAPDFFTGNRSCRYDHFAMGGGRIDARMRCGVGGGAGGAVQLTTLTGTYGPESYRMAMTTAMEKPAKRSAHGMEGMTMKLTVDGQRIGDCDTAEPVVSAKPETAS